MLLFKALEFELENDVINFCKNSVSELPEVDDFENSSKKINKTKESLLIPNGQNSNNSNGLVFYLIGYAVSFLKFGKIDTCGHKKIEETIGSDLYNQLSNNKEYLQLDLDYQRLEKICFQINKILSRHDYFLRIFESKKKINNLIKKKQKKKKKKKAMLKSIHFYY